MGIADPITGTVGLLSTLTRAGLIAPMRPDKYLRIVGAMQRENMAVTSGFAAAAQRCGDRAGLIDEIGILTWRQIDRRADALAAALQALPGGQPDVVALMARNHRGFVDTLIAANRIGADVLLLNTSFAGPALAEVVAREGEGRSLVLIYDEEFGDTVDRALQGRPETPRIVAWTDTDGHELTVEQLIDAHAGQEPRRATERSRTILLTSGTTTVAPRGCHSRLNDRMNSTTTRAISRSQNTNSAKPRISKNSPNGR
ncbi:2-succinylbenzoate--CoA ligase [Mycolicibacterium chubuense]|uniref:2-succinylbenzoate--CoA ligase n=1 Tax=Mycolicibacterium chubuense TaxID=1800 RepID=A0A0J6VSE7_MYCCU|nr:2-succinylbenzoate--CoA ligase [Mycolicibacterium chubuense]